ncbi:reverse transcriptase N-terminal domain-containing protein [Halopseudomonas pachastrellae]|nr:reverse transcriptase N-terminal domain-containing protein [Halopseudomonas pachastrellae]
MKITKDHDSAPSAVDAWHQLDWGHINRSVRKTQLKIAQATRDNDWRRVGRLQRLLTRSFYGRCWAVKRVTENRGRTTPGVMGKHVARPRPNGLPSVNCQKREGTGPNRFGGYGYLNPGKRKGVRWEFPRCWTAQCKRFTCLPWSQW